MAQDFLITDEVGGGCSDHDRSRARIPREKAKFDEWLWRLILPRLTTAAQRALAEDFKDELRSGNATLNTALSALRPTPHG